MFTFSLSQNNVLKVVGKSTNLLCVCSVKTNNNFVILIDVYIYLQDHLKQLYYLITMELMVDIYYYIVQ